VLLSESIDRLNGKGRTRNGRQHDDAAIGSVANASMVGSISGLLRTTILTAFTLRGSAAASNRREHGLVEEIGIENERDRSQAMVVGYVLTSSVAWPAGWKMRWAAARKLYPSSLK
jgi:hypothetical protein